MYYLYTYIYAHTCPHFYMYTHYIHNVIRMYTHVPIHTHICTCIHTHDHTHNADICTLRLHDMPKFHISQYSKLRAHVTSNIGLLAQIFYVLCQFLVCSGKSQLSTCVNAHCFQISIYTWFMSYHVVATLCYDIMTDVLWQP